MAGFFFTKQAVYQFVAEHRRFLLPDRDDGAERRSAEQDDAEWLAGEHAEAAQFEKEVEALEYYASGGNIALVARLEGSPESRVRVWALMRLAETITR